MNTIENPGNQPKIGQNKGRGHFLKILMRNQVKLEISNHAILYRTLSYSLNSTFTSRFTRTITAKKENTELTNADRKPYKKR